MSNTHAPAIAEPRWRLWTGRILSFLAVAQLLLSAFFRATQPAYATAEIVEGYGFPQSAILYIVIAECVLVLLYLVPPTAVLGALLLTGYLGGAVATHLRIGDTARAIIPVAVATLAWGGLYLRERRLRELLPIRRPS